MLGIKHIRTTPYHPQANDLIERWHRVLKTALKCHGAHKNWSEVLPVVMLGLRTAVKEDLGALVVEMVYGQVIRLPSDFVTEESDPYISENEFLTRLHEHFEKVRPTSMTQHGKKPVYVSKDLRFCDFVFLRDDTVRGPLKAPYDGPYKVLERHPKTYTVRVGPKPKTASIDRLKPAYVPAEVSEFGTENHEPRRVRLRDQLVTKQTEGLEGNTDVQSGITCDCNIDSRQLTLLHRH